MQKHICAILLGDKSLALLDILDDDVFGNVNDAASGSAKSDSHEDSY